MISSIVESVLLHRLMVQTLLELRPTVLHPKVLGLRDAEAVEILPPVRSCTCRCLMESVHIILCKIGDIIFLLVVEMLGQLVDVKRVGDLVGIALVLVHVNVRSV